MAVVALMATGCQKDRSFDGLILLAEGYNGNGTKLEVNGLYSEWAVGDEVFIKGAEGEGQTAIVNNTGNAQTSVSLANDPGAPYYGVYPSSIYIGNTGSSFTLKLPSTYDYAVSGGKQNLGSPMVAYAGSGNTLAFKHLTAAITVHFVNYYGFTVQIDSIEVISDKYKLSGTLSNLTIGSDTPDISAAPATTDAEKVVKMYGGASLQVFAGDSINVQVPVLPVGSDNHFTIKTYVHKVDQSAVVATIEKAQTTGGALARAGLGYARLATPGLFSVSATKKVVISQGNLKYQASTGTWKFSETQYGYIGNSVGNTTIKTDRETQSNWIDLFGWGTSGWPNGNTFYQPHCASITGWTNNDYGPKSGGTFYNLSGDYAKSDWGVNNPIYNGGNVAGRWYTLTNTEWAYLMDYSRAAGNTVAGTTRAKYTYANVNDIHGIIFFPDDFSVPTFTGSSSWGTINSRTAWSTVIELADWYLLEAAGCIFLPATGTRGALGATGTTPSVSDVNVTGIYWASVQKDNSNAYSVRVNASYNYGPNSVSKYQGYSVRLVRDVK